MTMGKQIPESARDFVEAADIRGQFLYREDGYIIAYLRLNSFNLDLVPAAKKAALTDNLVAQFRADTKDFVYFTLPREMDLDNYKVNLKMHYQNELKLGKRVILNIMMDECADLIMNGENYEHQHFIKVWALANVANKIKVEDALTERIQDFKNRYQSIGVPCEILQESEILKLCNLFGNSVHAAHEQLDGNIHYSSSMIL